MSYNDIKQKSPKELQTLLAEKQEELRALRFQASERQLKEVRKIRTVRKEIAHLLTALTAGETSRNA